MRFNIIFGPTSSRSLGYVSKKSKLQAIDTIRNRIHVINETRWTMEFQVEPEDVVFIEKVLKRAVIEYYKRP